MTRLDDRLANSDYARLAALIYNEAGIHLGTEKKTMLEVRLKRRLRALDIASYKDYCDYVFSSGHRQELIPLIDVVTTNKTDFFREPKHFDFLVSTALPELEAICGNRRPLVFWSAGCSSGEEPYTLAMVLNEYAGSHPGFRYHLNATDISTIVLAKAEQGIFSAESAAAVPAGLRRKYFMRSRDRESSRVRVVPELRHKIDFRRLNFMDADYGMAEKADAIFCRNVIIYFDRPTQERILQKLVEQLVPSGFLFVGHAETLHEMDLPLVPVAPSLYRKDDVEG